MKKVDLLVAILMAMMVFLDEGSGIYHSKEVDINRTTTIDVGKGGGYIGDKFSNTSTPSLRYIVQGKM